MKPITLLLLAVFALPLYSQNITNTLGTGGTFKIQDASSDIFLSLNQSTGDLEVWKNLYLFHTTSSSAGVIMKGDNRFIHDFAPSGGRGENTFMGFCSGNFTMSSGTVFEASDNVGVGYYSLANLTTGYQNTAVGAISLSRNTTGKFNTAIGYSSSFFDTTGSYNTSVGHLSLYQNTSGNYNTVIGYWAAYYLTTGSNNTLIGCNAEPSAADVSNEITLGNTDITSLRCQQTSITALSDARDKKNIKDLNLGIDFVMKVKPRLFNWDRRDWYKDNKSDGSRMQKTPTAGFIAQELDEVQTRENAEWLNLVLKNNPDRLEATPGNLLPVIVKAIQELKTENNELKARLDKFERMQSVLVTEIERLRSKGPEVIQAKNAN